MATFRLIKSECVPLTPELAEEFMNMEASPTEREMKPARIRHLQQQAGAGELVNFHWATAIRGKVTRRMNGRHSSTMLCGLNGFFPKGLYVHRDDYEVDDEEGEAGLFRKFDSRVSSRSALDVSGAYQGLYPELDDLNRVNAKLAIDAIAFYMPNVKRVDVPTGDDRYQLFERAQARMNNGDKGDFHDFLFWIDQVVTDAPELKRAPVVAAMFGTFQKNQAEARRFWSEVAQGGDEVAENHQYKLSTWLKTTKDRASRVTMTPKEFYAGAKYAWDTYRSGRAIKEIRCMVDRRKGLSEPIE